MPRYDAEWAAIEANEKPATDTAEEPVLIDLHKIDTAGADPFEVVAEYWNTYLIHLDHTVLTARDVVCMKALMDIATGGEVTV